MIFCKRTVYCELEKQVFLEILKHYKHIIEAKSTNSATLKQKCAAWSAITNKYNESSLISTKVLRNMYMYIYLFYYFYIIV